MIDLGKARILSIKGPFFWNHFLRFPETRKNFHVDIECVKAQKASKFCVFIVCMLFPNSVILFSSQREGK